MLPFRGRLARGRNASFGECDGWLLRAGFLKLRGCERERTEHSARDNVKTLELKQFGELDAEDFQRHPVWIGCHTADYGRPWHEDTDDETFRPYSGKLPVDPSEGMLLVRAVIELKDGSRYPGFVTPGSGLG